jgi:hypothetical protein
MESFEPRSHSGQESAPSSLPRWVGALWYEKNLRYSLIGATGILAFYMSWIISTEGTKNQTRAAIQEVLRQDKLVGQETAQKAGILDKYWDGSSLVREVALRMDAIDLGRCPEDFQIAYKRHVSAWASLASTKASNEGLNGFLKGFFTGGLAMMPASSQYDEATKEHPLNMVGGSGVCNSTRRNAIVSRAMQPEVFGDEN